MAPLEDPLAYIRHPHDVGLNSRLEVATLELRDGMKPTNTSKTMEPKIEEFFQFCERVYPNDQHKYNLDYEKVYRFMWYQAFREQKDQKAVRVARANGVYFDYEMYKAMMDRFNADNPQAYPIPSKPIGKCTFNMYKACFRRIYKTQVARRVSYVLLNRNCAARRTWHAARGTSSRHSSREINSVPNSKLSNPCSMPHVACHGHGLQLQLVRLI